MPPLPATARTPRPRLAAFPKAYMQALVKDGSMRLQEWIDLAAGLGIEHLLVHPLREAREAFERDYITAQLGRFGGNISKTAQFIGMERSALHRKIKLLGLASRNEEDTEV